MGFEVALPWNFDRLRSGDLRQIAAQKIDNYAIFSAVLFGRNQDLCAALVLRRIIATRYRALDAACFDVSCVELEETSR